MYVCQLVERIVGAEMSAFGQDHDGMVRGMSRRGGWNALQVNTKSCDRTPAIHCIIERKRGLFHHPSFLDFKAAHSLPLALLDLAI